MTTVVTRGAASAQALGYAARATAANYIEDMFSTYLYTGNNSTQTITNGIDLSGKGGLVWLKCRDVAHNHALIDTSRGGNKVLRSNSTTAQLDWGSDGITSFNSNGFTMYDPGGGSGRGINETGSYASWTFRKQAKFFDVVTYTGDGSNRTISHNLGSVPGSIFVKRTDTTGNWQVYHRSLANTEYLVLNSTAAKATGATRWNSTTPTSTVFSVGTDATVNANGGTYVAYLFAHDAGGFGLTGTDNVISCGSGTSNGSGVINPVTLGYEPQFIIAKATGTTSHWFMFDVMRGDSLTSVSYLRANTSDAETTTSTPYIYPTATGFAGSGNFFGANEPFIYIAIRRGPMRTPTSGTSVFSPNVSSGGSTTEITTGFPSDLAIYNLRAGTASNSPFVDRLRGLAVNSSSTSNTLISSSTDAEAGYNIGYEFWNTGFKIGSYFASNSNVFYSFRRAPGFFDVVCYTGTGSATTQSHNLGVAPELMIVKVRSNASGWQVYSSALANTDYLILNTTAASVNGGSTRWNSTTPTSSVFSLGTHGAVNGSGDTYVAYLFATVAGVSKVGSYTGTGTTLQVNCGFTGGARFVLIKRTDSTGDWYVWDSARGIVAGNDPYLLLNSTAAEVTGTDYVDTYSAGFEISSTAPAAINANGGAFIFLAIA
jgi:hypothetical protein